jgi:hypothetical protein
VSSEFVVSTIKKALLGELWRKRVYQNLLWQKLATILIWASSYRRLKRASQELQGGLGVRHNLCRFVSRIVQNDKWQSGNFVIFCSSDKATKELAREVSNFDPILLLIQFEQARLTNKAQKCKSLMICIYRQHLMLFVIAPSCFLIPL